MRSPFYANSGCLWTPPTVLMHFFLATIATPIDIAKPIQLALLCQREVLPIQFLVTY